MHASNFLFDCVQAKRKQMDGIRNCHSVRCMQTLMDTTGATEKEIKKAMVTNTAELVTFTLTCGRCGICKTQSECMPCKVNGGYNWLRQKSIRPAEQERVLIINHSLMQKARNDAPKEGGSNRIGQETSEIKRVKR